VQEETTIVRILEYGDENGFGSYRIQKRSNQPRGFYFQPAYTGWGHEKVARLPFAFAFGYCINFCIYATLRTRATFSWPILYNVGGSMPGGL